MAGLLEKVRIGVLAQAHNLLDKLIDINSPQAVKQYIRDLESSISGIENDAAEAAGHVTTTDREIHRLMGQIESYDHAIDTILSSTDPSANDKARELQVKLNGFKQQLDAKQVGACPQAKETADAITHSLSALRSKHREHGSTTVDARNHGQGRERQGTRRAGAATGGEDLPASAATFRWMTSRPAFRPDTMLRTKS